MSLTLLPALDIADGRAVRSRHAAADDPARIVRSWVRQGATWLHLVDLDRAFRRGDNAEVVAQLVAGSGVPVQLSGGIDDLAGAERALATGASRVNLASTAAADPELIGTLVEAHGARIVVGLDLRASQVVARGTDVHVGALEEVVAGVAASGAQEFLVADASRDGSRRGVDVELFGAAVAAIRRRVPHARVALSGGVSQLSDLRRLTSLEHDGVWAVVLGSALHHGHFDLAQARAAVAGVR